MDDDLYIGLMSGTSLDGIDASLVRFKNEQPVVLETLCLPLPSKLKAANDLMTKAKIKKINVIAIGSHGQTIRHLPTDEHPSTLQIADPNIIAEITGISTVADFRRRDMAAGGQGAPLVPAFHEQIFRHKTKNRVILNLGGIANITVISANKNIQVTGFDTGPANTLINHWIQQQQNKNYDDAGNWASTGKSNDDFVEHLLDDDYFKLAPPKSTGTEYFNPTWLTKKLSEFPFLSAEDVQASLTIFTALSISDAINTCSDNIDEMIVCGGGVHNKFLLQQLQKGLPNIEINSSAKYNLDPDYIEASAFAWLAKQTMEHKAGNLLDVTGAKRAVVLGGVYYS